jgi:hypothetical protein
MNIQITNRRTQESEKEFDEPGRISIIRFYHWTVTSDEDLRPHIYERDVSWYNCRKQPVKESPLEEALRGLFGSGRIPGLSGIRSVSEDGRTMEFCWR